MFISPDPEFALSIIFFTYFSVNGIISSSKSTSFFSIVNIVSAKILAMATIALFFSILFTKLSYLLFIFLEYFITVCAASTKRYLNIDGPSFVMCPFLSFFQIDLALILDPHMMLDSLYS